MTSPGCFPGRSCFLLGLAFETVCLCYPNWLQTCDFPSLASWVLGLYVYSQPHDQPSKLHAESRHEKLHSSCLEFKVITPRKPPANWASFWIMIPSLKETAFGFDFSDQRKRNMEQVPLKEATVSFVGFPRIALLGKWTPLIIEGKEVTACLCEHLATFPSGAKYGWSLCTVMLSPTSNQNS